LDRRRRVGVGNFLHLRRYGGVRIPTPSKALMGEKKLKPQRRGVLGLHRVEQYTCPHRLNESVGAAQQVFKLIFFMEGRKKSHVTLLLKTYEALIRMAAKTRASQEPPVRGDLTGW